MPPATESSVVTCRAGLAAPWPEATASAAPAAPLPERARLSLDPQKCANGLVALVLAVLEVIRQVLLKQAIRRMEGGSLDDLQIERLGSTLMRLEETMGELKAHFGLSDEDLNLDLGPLGRLF